MSVLPLTTIGLVSVIFSLVVNVYVALVHPSSPSVRFMLHQNCSPGVEKLVFVCIMFSSLSAVPLWAKVCHVPEELLRHVAFIVSTASESLTVMFNVGVGHTSVLWLTGPGLLCVGALFGTGGV